MDRWRSGTVAHGAVMLGRGPAYLLALFAAVGAIGPAPADTRAHDLTAGALGLAVEVAFTEPQSIAPLVVDGEGTGLVEVDEILFTPTRPGALLRVAAERRLPIS